MKYFPLVIFLAGALLYLGIDSAQVAVAAPNPYVADCTGTVQGGICFPTDTGLSDKPIMLLLGRLMFWLLAVVGVIAIIAFVIAGMQYLASAGDAKLAEKGKASMINAIIGIVIALSGLVIIQAINTWFTASGTVAF